MQLCYLYSITAQYWDVLLVLYSTVVLVQYSTIIAITEADRRNIIIPPQSAVQYYYIPCDQDSIIPSLHKTQSSTTIKRRQEHTMLFPAVHELGFKAGQACWNLYYSQSTLPPPSLPELWQLVREAPASYKAWWLNLVENDPLHVAIETTLIISIIYMIFWRNNEGYKNNLDGGKLTPQEEDELLWEWKHKLRSPLAPPLSSRTTPSSSSSRSTTEQQPSIVPSVSSASSSSSNYDDDLQIIVQKQEGKWLTITTNNCDIVPISPTSSSSMNTSTTNGQQQQPTKTTSSVVGIISKTRLGNATGSGGSSKAGKKIKSVQLSPPPDREMQQQQKHATTAVELKVLNFCNFDFLGFQTSDTIRDASTKALNKYGCGSCGPRGFYGTIDTHLQLEESIAQFTRTDNAIMYSDGASTCSSTVAAFAKRGDVLVVDEGVYEPITTGVTLSRANVHWFKHNDVEDLERVLKELQATDRRLKRQPNAQRRFIVVEGLYKNIGSIAPLDKIVELKHKYHYRLMLDESFSFGTLGETGRGALEEYGKRPMHDAEIITIALENSLGSVGGVTVGNEEVVDHQRLSGAGYCFSASAPPFTASAAVASLKVMEEKPELIKQLQSNVRYMYQKLEERLTTPKLIVTSDIRSPIVVLQLEHESIYEAAVMRGIMRECLKRGIAVVATGQDASSHSRTELAPCIRMTVSAIHTPEDIEKAVQALVESSGVVLSQFPL